LLSSSNPLLLILQPILTFFFFKTSYLDEEVNRTEPSLQLVLLGTNLINIYVCK
jgi:hypothetical protein